MKKFLRFFLIGLVAVLVGASLLRISKGVQAQTKLQTTYGSEAWTTGITVENGTEIFRHKRADGHQCSQFPV